MIVDSSLEWREKRKLNLMYSIDIFILILYNSSSPPLPIRSFYFVDFLPGCLHYDLEKNDYMIFVLIGISCIRSINVFLQRYAHNA